MHRFNWNACLGLLAYMMACACGNASAEAGEESLSRQIEAVRMENLELRHQLQRQEELLGQLSDQLAKLTDANENPKTHREPAPTPVPRNSSGNVILSGTGAAAFFHSESQGASPNAEFKVDELRLFLDAAVHEDIYAFVELNLATREAEEFLPQLGEAYIDFENVSALWGVDQMMSIRLGRMDVPFGEEYLHRDAINNPLISHSLMDFWGIDEGIELYGVIGRVNYVLAVQNGSYEGARDYTADKSVALRLGYDASDWLHLGLSAMRTGELEAHEEWSEIWIGNGFYRSIGSTNTTRFDAHIVQGDVRLRLPAGHVHISGGYSSYDDNDPGMSNHRDIWFYSVEAVHDLPSRFFGGARFSQMFVDEGFPIVGQGGFGPFFFGPLTEEIWRLSLGLGYRWSDNLVLKLEYSFEEGRLVNGSARRQEDLFSAQAAWRF